MALAHDAVSCRAWGGGGSAVWDHTPSGTPKGVFVFIMSDATTLLNRITSVTYGGVTMVNVVEVADITGELGCAEAWFLGSAIPTGKQQVSVSGTGSQDKHATCVTVTAALNTAIVVTGSIGADAADPSIALDSGAETAIRYAAIFSGQASTSSLTAATDCTDLTNTSPALPYQFPPALTTAHVVRQDTPSSGSFTIGWSGGSDDVAMVAVAIKEFAGTAHQATVTLAGIVSASISAIYSAAGAVTLAAAVSTYFAAPATREGTATLACSGSISDTLVNTWTARARPTTVVGYIDQGHTFNGHPMRHGWGKFIWNPTTGKAYCFDGYGETGGDWSDSDGNIYSRAIWEFDPVGDTFTLLRVCNWSYVASITTELIPENTNVPTPWPRHPYGCIDICPERGSLILVGGADTHVSASVRKADVWEFTIATRTWVRLGHHDVSFSGDGTPPYDINIPRSIRSVYEQSMVWDSNLKKFILFGARNDALEKSRDVFSLDPATNTWAGLGNTGAPDAEWWEHGTCFDTSRNVMWLFGGGIGGGASTDRLYKYDLNTNTWTQITKTGAWPTARAFANLTYDSRWDRIILFGGESKNDTWWFDPDSGLFTEIYPTTSPAANSARSQSLVYDTNRLRAILRSSDTYNEGVFWEYIYVEPAASGAVLYAGMATLPATATVSAAGSMERQATSTISVTATVSAAGSMETQATSTMSASANVTASGEVVLRRSPGSSMMSISSTAIESIEASISDQVSMPMPSAAGVDVEA